MTTTEAATVSQKLRFDELLEKLRDADQAPTLADIDDLNKLFDTSADATSSENLLQAVVTKFKTKTGLVVNLLTNMLVKLKAHRLIRNYYKDKVAEPTKYMERKQLLKFLAHLVVDNFSPLKCGKDGTYCNEVAPSEHAKEYLGHNIVAMAVDNRSLKVVAIEYNFVDCLASPLEHAEQRLIRRLFADEKFKDYRNGRSLQFIDLYSSLEPCQQCSGVCLLANVTSVLWLQTDPRIKVIIDRMSKDEYEHQVETAIKREKYDDKAITPKPLWFIACKDLYDEKDDLKKLLLDLENGYQAWQEKCHNSKDDVLFFEGNNPKKLGDCDGIPYFLCTKEYLDIFTKLAAGAPQLSDVQGFDLTKEVVKQNPSK